MAFPNLYLDDWFDPSQDFANGLPDYSRALMRAQESIVRGRGVKILVRQTPQHLDPSGAYGESYVFQNRVDVIRALTLETEVQGDHGVAGATFQWVAGFTGVGFECHFPTSYPPDPEAGSLLCARGLQFLGPGYGAGLANHGLLAHNRMVLEACSFVQWGGDGIRVLSGPLPSGVQAVADFCSISACWIDQVGGSGIYLHGGDAQVGLIQRTGCHNFGLVAGADAAGFWDDSFFGNLWLACDANPIIDVIPPAHLGDAPAYRATQQTSTALFVDCYTEGPGATSPISRPNMIVSGTNMVITPGYDGVVIRGQQYGASIFPALATPNASDPAETVEAFMPSDAPIGRVVLAFGSAAEGPGATWRLQHRGATGFFPTWWALVGANYDPNTALLIADTTNPSASLNPPGTVWLYQARTRFGPNGNTLEWADGAPPAETGHQAGDVVFNSGAGAVSPNGWRFDGSAWHPF